ncbi:hypothetical protein KTF56_18750 [Burkholderia gladioli]|uniref:hypothetical protein n=1 Tax=Burkholderia gladioli TaxID=28095 RepID=UPI001C245027|nr:hypothetical protein [Burkholderia gladioli]MBU9684917.1 hypothetical protein [Burkholderia gladioli]
MKSNDISSGRSTPTSIPETSTTTSPQVTTPTPPPPTRQASNNALSQLTSQSNRQPSDLGTGTSRPTIRARSGNTPPPVASSSRTTLEHSPLTNRQPPKRPLIKKTLTSATEQERAMIGGGSESGSVHSLQDLHHDTTLTESHHEVDLESVDISDMGALRTQMDNALVSLSGGEPALALHSPASLEALHQALDVDNAPLPRTQQERTMAQSVVQFAQAIVDGGQRGVISAAHSLAVRLPTVYGPTFLRQLAGQGLGGVLNDKHTSKDVQAMVGLLLTMAPVALLVAGMMRDKEKGVQTDASRNSRLALMAIGSVMGMAAIGTGSMAGASASLGAFVLYCAMRDGMQQFVKLNPKDRDGPESRDPTVKDSALSGGAYTVDEFGVGMGMSYTSSPSGAGAAGEVLQTAHGAERAGWNTAGEVFDDWVSNAIKKGGIPDLRAGIEMPTLEGFKDTLTGAFPARATLFTATTLLSQIIADKSTHASPATQTAVNNLGVAMLLGLMYVPFAQMGNIRKPAPGETARGPILPTTATTTATDNGGALTRRNARANT